MKANTAHSPSYPYPSTIVKEEASTLPRAVYSGRIVEVNDYSAMLEAVGVLSRSSMLGFDTETKPTWTEGGRPNPVALLQLATADVCYLFQLHRLGLPMELVHLLERTDILKIGLGLSEDLKALRRREKFTAGGFVELQRLAPGYGIVAQSLQSIYAIVCGGYISKGQQMSNWEAKTLTQAQRAYAAMDASACLEIYQALRLAPNPDPLEFARYRP